MIVPLMFHLLDLTSCTPTRSPGLKAGSVDVSGAGREVARVGRVVRCLCQKKISAGDFPRDLGVFLNSSSRLSWKASKERHLSSKYLQFLTAASASQLDCGLYGNDGSCLMPYVLQKLSNSDLNWGPWSDLMHAAKPKSINQDFNFLNDGE